MQLHTIFFIIVNDLHVSGSSPPIIRRSKTVHTASGICQACLLLPLAWVSWNSPMLAEAASKQAWHISDAACTVFELLMMGGETAW